MVNNLNVNTSSDKPDCVACTEAKPTVTILLSLLLPSLGLGLLAMSPQAPPPAPAPPAKCSPPSAEELCIHTFHACWFIDKDWLISFTVSAQHPKLDAPISWVEFVPKGHTHLVYCTLKLVPPTRALPVAKIKECMFLFLLEVLNGPGAAPGFFAACKVGKLWKRLHKHKGKGDKSADMAVDSPDPSTVAGGSTQEPEALRGDGDPPPLEGSSEPTACTQHFPGPSSEEPQDGGSSSEDPYASLPLTPLPVEPMLQAPMAALALSAHARQVQWDQESIAAQLEWKAASWSLSLVPSIASVLGKHPPSPPPPSSPPPALGLPVALAALDWCTWMQHKQATYLHDNLGKVALVMVTPLDLYDAASAAATAPSLGPLGSPFSPSHPSHLTGCACHHLSLSPRGCPRSPKSACPLSAQLGRLL